MVPHDEMGHTAVHLHGFMRCGAVRAVACWCSARGLVIPIAETYWCCHRTVCKKKQSPRQTSVLHFLECRKILRRLLERDVFMREGRNPRLVGVYTNSTRFRPAIYPQLCCQTIQNITHHVRAPPWSASPYPPLSTLDLRRPRHHDLAPSRQSCVGS